MSYEPIGRIRPVAPAPSLLTAARPLPNVNWQSGVSWSTSCQRSYSWAQCPDLDALVAANQPGVSIIDGGRYKALPDDRAVVHTMPFTIYTPYLCVDAGSMGEGAIADSEELLKDLTEVHTANQVASALWMGEGYDDADHEQPTLRRSAVDVSGAAPLDLDDAIASLLAHYQLSTGGSGGAVIHMPGVLLTGALGGGGGGARVCWPEGSVYRGPHGSVFVAGPGYPEGSSHDGARGHGPMIDDSPQAYAGNAANTSWVYITGPVEYAANDVRLWPEDPVDRFIPRTNTMGAFGEREAIVRFDPCSVFAIEVVNPAPLPEVS